MNDSQHNVNQNNNQNNANQQNVPPVTRQPRPGGTWGARRPSQRPDNTPVPTAMEMESQIERFTREGFALYKQGQYADAETCYRQALAFNPADANLHTNLGIAQAAQGLAPNAMLSFQRAVSLAPDYYPAHFELGHLYEQENRVDEAEAAWRKVLALNPSLAAVYQRLGSLCLEQQRCDEAEDLLGKAIALEPNHPYSNTLLGLIYLRRGDFVRGWSGIAWLLELRTGISTTWRRGLTQPRWEGQSLSGKRILVCADSGFGDIIQFVRFLPLLQKRGATVILEYPAAFGDLFGDLEGCDVHLVTRTAPPPLPLNCSFDYYSELIRLPFVLKVPAEEIAVPTPYLKVPAGQMREWRERLEEGDGFKIGIVWNCSKTQEYHKTRSCPLAEFAPLSALPGVCLYSLQKGAGEDEAASPPAGVTLRNLTPDLHDFTDTAAAILNLDLVITVDTSVAHLAGALGRPVWTLLRHHADWRWQDNRADSPWYPTMRLFRQPSPGDWNSVISDVCRELQAPLRRDHAAALHFMRSPE